MPPTTLPQPDGLSPDWTSMGPAIHPRDVERGLQVPGTLVRHHVTGRYALHHGTASLRSVPQDWARATAAALGQAPEPELKDTPRTFRLSARAAAALVQLARERGDSQAEVLEQLILDAATPDSVE